MTSETTVKNYIDGEWIASASTVTLPVCNPATDEPLAHVPMSTPDEVDQAVNAAHAAFWEWRETPPYTRARYMFDLKQAMEDSFEDLATIITQEHGKIIDESRGEVRRAIENVEVAAGVPSLMMGYNMEDVAQGIDEEAVRQPLGVFSCIAPFNFPAMVPFWFLPYAIATGNTYVIKPSEQAPLSQVKLYEMMDEIDLPPGVVNLVHGAAEVGQALIEHPHMKGVSFVGSTPIARRVYEAAAQAGIRAQCQGGAKNFLVVMPDAIMDQTVPNILTSCFGTAGQRCLAGAVVVAVGDSYEPLKEKLVEAARALTVGDGLDESVQMGPVISREAQERITGYVDKGVEEGATLLLDGRGIAVEGYENGYFVGPTIFDDVNSEMSIAQDEIFGPVMSIMQVGDFEEALEVIDRSPYGNAASLFTSNGGLAREFKYRVEAGNIGINIGIAAPIASFPFGGQRDSFFGVMHGQGLDGIDFFTDRKVVISRWF
jgi:malonate-semialdehyde dehydrogenase (acetylating)/methylmalonate-semialdehyde dehydrogenase